MLCYRRAWWFRVFREILASGIRIFAMAYLIRPKDYLARSPMCFKCIRFRKNALKGRSALFNWLLVQHRFCKFPAGWFCAATRPRRTSPAGDFFGVFFPHIHEGIDNMAQRVEHHPCMDAPVRARYFSSGLVV